MGGKFTHIAGHAQKALGTVNATTGACDPYFTGPRRLHPPQHAGSDTHVLAMSSNPTNTELVVVGNFTSVDGQPARRWRSSTSPPRCATLSTWSTKEYTAGCSSKFESYMMDVEYSPDGSFFAASRDGRLRRLHSTA